MRPELVVDIGHSCIKWAPVRQGVLDTAGIGRALSDRPGLLYAAVADLGAKQVLLSGQAQPESVARIADRLRRGGIQIDIISTGDRALPVAPAYPSLGCDRWLALQKPRLETSAPFVVVDAGTAITIDLVDGQGRHRGGWIMAGIAAARSGLLARAPQLDRPVPGPGPIDQPACDTGQALARGGLMLATGGIERAIEAAERAVNEPIDLWLTGGDATELALQLRRSARLEPHLVLYGLALATQTQ